MNKIINSDCIEGMKSLPDNSIDCYVTSPPYFGLRDYGHDGQIGLEETPEQYVAKMVEVFEQVRRVLKPAGTLWLNLGDSYARSGGESKGESPGIMSHMSDVQKRLLKVPDGLKQKDLIGIPWMVAFALRSAGWYLRQDIIWHKPNPMPESVTDRCTKAHEYIFLMSKSQRYYYDHEAIKQPIAEASIERLNQNINGQQGSDRVPGKTNGRMKAVSTVRKQYDNSQAGGGSNIKGHSGGYRADGTPQDYLLSGKANKRSVWTVTTKPFKEAHFATFPEDLIVDCIKAGYPEGGTVLDPFGGAGTTAVVAKKLNRNYVLFELNPAYIEIIDKRLHQTFGLFNHQPQP